MPIDVRGLQVVGLDAYHQPALAAISLLGARAGECDIQTTPALTAPLRTTE